MENLLTKHNISSKSHPILINEEIKLDPSKSIMSKTDSRGVIEYANDYFMEISGYQEFELMGQPHNVIRHPDMPKVIFKTMWEELKKGNNIFALVKNLAKDGRYYWVLVSFEIKHDSKGNIVSYYAYRKAAPGHAVYEVDKLYKKIRAIETNQNVDVAYKYFNGLLEEKNLSYGAFISSLLNVEQGVLANYFENKKEKKKSLLNRLFRKG